MEILNSLPKEFFAKAIQDLVLRWRKCVAAKGDFFEGDNINPGLIAQETDSNDSSNDMESDEDEEWLQKKSASSVEQTMHGTKMSGVILINRRVLLNKEVVMS